MKIPTTFRSVRVRAALSLGLVLSLGTVGTLAAWSSTATTTSGVFTTGTVNIRFDDGSPLGNEGIGTPYPVPLPTAALLPGQSTAALVKVQNVGNVRFTHTRSVSVVTPGIAVTSRVTNGAVLGTGTVRTCGGTEIAPTSARVVEIGGVDTVCVQVNLPTPMLTTQQGSSASVDIVFTAVPSVV